MLYKVVDWVTSKVIARVNPLEVLLDKKTESCIKKYVNHALGGKEGDAIVKKFKAAYETNKTQAIVLFYGLARKELKKSSTITSDKFIDLLAKTYVLVATQSSVLFNASAKDFGEKLKKELDRISKLIAELAKRNIQETNRIRYAIKVSKRVLKDIGNLTPENRKLLEKVLNVIIPQDNIFEDLRKQYILFKKQYERLLARYKTNQVIKEDVARLEQLLKQLDKKLKTLQELFDNDLKKLKSPLAFLGFIDKVLSEISDIHKIVLKYSDYAKSQANNIERAVINVPYDELYRLAVQLELKLHGFKLAFADSFAKLVIGIGLASMKEAIEKNDPNILIDISLIRDILSKLPQKAIVERYKPILEKYAKYAKKIRSGNLNVKPEIAKLIKQLLNISVKPYRNLDLAPVVKEIEAEIKSLRKTLYTAQNLATKNKTKLERSQVTQAEIEVMERQMKEKQINLEQLAKRSRAEIVRGFKEVYKNEYVRTIYAAIKECLKGKKDTIDKLLKTVNNTMKWIERYYKYRKFVPVALVAASILVQVIMLKRLGYLKSYREAINPKKLVNALINAVKHGSRKVKFAVAVLNLLLLAGVAMGGILLLQKYSDKLTLDKIFEKASEIDLSA